MKELKESFLKNGSFWRMIIVLLTAALAAGGLVMTIKANTERIRDVEKTASERLSSVEATATINRESAIGIKKDIERLNEKVTILDNRQEKIFELQQEILREVKR